MCFLSMKMFGTDRWLVISYRASWSSAPSSRLCQPPHVNLQQLCERYPSGQAQGYAPLRPSRSAETWSLYSMGTMIWRRRLTRRQHSTHRGHPFTSYAPTELLSMMSCALVFAAMMVFGLAGRRPKKFLKKFVLGDWIMCLAVKGLLRCAAVVGRRRSEAFMYRRDVPCLQVLL